MELTKCPVSEACGGCSYQGISYDDQLKNKENEVRGHLKRAGFSPDLLEGITGCPERYAYRNKMEYTFGNESKDGPLRLGMHRKKSFISVVDASCCEIVPEDFNRIVKAVTSFCS